MRGAVAAAEFAIARMNSFIWSPFMLAVLLGTGFYFSVRTGFIQVFKLKSVLRETVGKAFRSGGAKASKGGITPFQALSTALGGTLGTGNIAGVAAAITIAGPGAVFWMWFSALFGMMTKYAEIVLAIRYRRRDARGEWLGGPMIYIGEGLRMKRLAAAYAFLGVAASFGVGNLVQANAVSAAVSDAFGVPPLYTGICLAAIVGLTVVGGIKNIASVTEKVIPFMSVLYTLSALLVILCRWHALPRAAALILSGAFTPAAPIGGFAGAAVSVAVQKGISRGIFTNEAGLGSASIAHAAAETDHPARQGLWGIFEVFFDTVVMCSVTAFAILSTDVWTSGLTGVSLTIAAFDTVLRGAGKYVIAVSLAVFAFASILAWSFYGKKCAAYLFGERCNNYYLTAFVAAAALGAITAPHLVWELSDALNGLMAVPNMIGLICLSGVVIRLTKDGLRKMRFHVKVLSIVDKKT
ncbi:MAG: sodium:alanine symporter family protein [Clostridiales bacterium]|jgi:AGCS family alanine or glycine:cation symporter|nr:sodium:alanine symporter family protein [Clostridiales bacterium]